MLPYDGSPGGNALGMQIDEQRRASYEASTAISLSSSEDEAVGRDRSHLQVLSYLLFIATFVLVMLYASFG